MYVYTYIYIYVYIYMYIYIYIYIAGRPDQPPARWAGLKREGACPAHGCDYYYYYYYY